MTDNQYFTPSIEDIRVGYECERVKKIIHKTGSEPIVEWEHYIIPHGLFLKETLEKMKIRVPYLTKEQIEAEGWKYIPYSGTNPPLRFLRRGRSIEYTIESKLLQIEHESDYNEQGCSPVYIYNRECKDINTFRWICKLLGI